MNSQVSLIFPIFFLVLVIIMVVAISILLISLSKQGDERKKHIKTKAMANSFVVILIILIIDVVRTIVMMILGLPGSPYPFIYLFIISLAFLVALIVNKKKYGD
ncbi:hypothetical protein AAC03nite_38840 [Alicyclobacillus acidoterrestris]|nr:hypothetical protein AAC03nite_38840 [Alicyclobacillus acidoterrestris]